MTASVHVLSYLRKNRAASFDHIGHSLHSLGALLSTADWSRGYLVICCIFQFTDDLGYNLRGCDGASPCSKHVRNGRVYEQRTPSSRPHDSGTYFWPSFMTPTIKYYSRSLTTPLRSLTTVSRNVPIRSFIENLKE